MTSTSKRILIVDDEEDLTWSIARSLRKQSEQYEIICVNSGDEAIEVLKRLSLDLIISDIRMPGTDGLVLMELINQYQPEIKVIIMSAWEDPEIKALINKRNGICYLEKPFDINDLKQTIYQAFQSSGNRYKSRLIDVNLKDIIRHNCQNKFNGHLKITNGNKNGVIYFRAGEVIHAQVGELEGEKAFLDVLNWNDCQCDTVLTDAPIKKSIHQDWKTLLEKSRTHR